MRDLIIEYLFQYADAYGILPETEEVQEHFEPREIDYDLIEKTKQEVKLVIPWVS
jgi:hypothetical protein